MQKAIILSLFLFSLIGNIHGQMSVNGQNLYGNEWINYEQKYYKIKISKDGIYRIGYQDMINAGVPVDEVTGKELQVFFRGNEIPLRVSNQNQLSEEDYFEFYGIKNKGEIDRYIYELPEERQLNSEYSLFSDTSSYFLTWSQSLLPLRYREIENQLDGPLPITETFYIHEEKRIYTAFHLKPTRNGIDRIRYSSLDVSEGFGSSLRRTQSINFQPKHIYTDGPKPSIHIRFGGNSVSHIPELSVNNTRLKSLSYSGYEVKEFNEPFEIEELKSTTNFKIYGKASNNDRSVLASVKLKYPRSFHFSNENSVHFTLEPDIASKYLKIMDFQTDSEPAIIYDLSNQYYLKTNKDQDTIKVHLPASNQTRNLILVNSTSGILNADHIEEIQFEDYSQVDAEYLILSNKKLYDDFDTGINWVEEYASYRSSTEGGGFQTAVIDIEQLYDQFAYGINHHSIAVRNFVQYVVEYWTSPEFLFIIGKAREYPGVRTPVDLLNSKNASFYVPTFGVPGSDNILVSRLGSTVPLLPVGRLAAQSPEDIRIYLEKVKLHENPINNDQTIEDQLWKKKVIHLSGGDALIQEVIFSFLKEMEGTIEKSSFGASVTTFRKTSTDPIQSATSQRIIDAINDGVAFITFFGHSAVGTFDFSLEEPGKYNNYGKYPMIISLGCHSGNIHTEAYGLSEDFVIEEDKGAIAFLASSGSAYISPQYNSGNDFYELAGGRMNGESIGKILQEALRKRDNNYNISVRTLNEQLALHGDPAIKMHPKTGPDLTFDFSSVKSIPPIVSTYLDSFELEYDVVNLGKSTSDSLQIKIQHFLPEGQNAYESTIRIKAPEFSNRLSTMIPVPKSKSIGKNQIQISLDIKDEIQELPSPLAESNNILESENGEEGFCFYILDNGARPIYPSEFSIVLENEVVLKASTNNAFIEQQKYRIEIDTSELYNSPLLETFEMTHNGGVITWKPNIEFIPSTVYYWRISPETNATGVGYLWENSSFIYLPESDEGWNQSHIYQFLKDTYVRMHFNENRKLQFDTAGITITIHNKAFDEDVVPGLQFDFGNIAASVRPYRFMDAGLAFWVVREGIYNDDGGVGWVNSGGDYGSFNTNDVGSYRTFAYDTNTETGRENAVNFLENVVPDGAYVFAFAFIRDENDDYSPDDWSEITGSNGKSLFDVFEANGAQLVRQIEERGSVPYTFIFQKGREIMAEDIAENKADYLRTSAILPSLFSEGKITSTLLGPAQSWGHIEWEITEETQTDENYLNVYGYTLEMERVLLLSDQVEERIDLSGISAMLYPYIQIEMLSKDVEESSAANLEYWRVFYTELPDAAMLADENEFIFIADTLMQGEELLLEMQMENTSSSNMDSVLVKYSIIDSENKEDPFYTRFGPLDSGVKKKIRFNKNTTNLKGNYQLTVELNPDNDQPEKYKFNNFGILEFYVEGDIKNPLIDVTFDGIHIMDGDLVSPSPFILIELKDDNPFLLLDDISSFQVDLKLPDGTLQNIPLDHSSISFIPATEGSENKAKLEYTPNLTEGEYKLIIQARDKSGNFSGDNAYEIHFVVIEKTSISQVLNYPNPFSSSTQFVFTLTGEVPPSFLIRIMTLSGKVVREITKEELGNLHVGINRTSYRWEGTDEFGSRLANGVYLYQVITQTQAGEEYESIQNNLNQFFKEGFGKLVIMR